MKKRIKIKQLSACALAATLLFTSIAPAGSANLEEHTPLAENNDKTQLPVVPELPPVDVPTPTADTPSALLGVDNKEVETTNINLALGKSVMASGVDSGFVAENAVDGNKTTTRWASAAGTTPEVHASWLYVDLGDQPVSYNKIEITHEAMATEYEVMVSSDAQTWESVGGATHEDSKSITKGTAEAFTFETPRTERYVKFQGVRPCKKVDGDLDRWGYSLYELSVYETPKDDAYYIEQAQQQVKVPERTKNDFPLEFKADGHVTIAWESSDEAIAIDADKQLAVVTRSGQDQTVTLTATFCRNEARELKQYTVIIPAKVVVEGAYEIYPLVHNATYADEQLALTGEVNLVLEADLDAATSNKAKLIFEQHELTVTTSSALASDKTNVLVGVDNDEGADNTFFDGKYDAEQSTEKDGGYVLAVDGASNTIAVMGKDSTAAFYGITTLAQILEQKTDADTLRTVQIEDYAEVKFRGFIEGFYGTPWSHANRKDLMEFGGDYKMTSYLYGPKDDEYHAKNWKTPYPQDKLEELKELVDTGIATKVEFVWAAHVGGRIDLGADADFTALTKKFDQMYDIGVRQFALFFDDASTNNAQLVSFVTRLDREYIKPKGDVKPLIFCPQYYRKDDGTAATINYLQTISAFPQDVEIMWTGDGVLSKIKQSTVDWVTQYIKRPVYIWWNYPVNDLGRVGYVHMGPTNGLYPGITNMSGFTSNPMNQAQASKVALFGVADYTWNSGDFDTQTSWENSFHHIIRDDAVAADALHIFSQHSSASNTPFNEKESWDITPQLDAFSRALNQGADITAEADTLLAELDKIAAAVDTLQSYSGTGGISKELAPWLDKLGKIADCARNVVESAAQMEPIDPGVPSSIQNALDAISRGREELKTVNTISQTVGSAQLLPFVKDVLECLEARLMTSLYMQPALIGYGTAPIDYTQMLDGDMSTGAEITNKFQVVGIGDYFGINLGKPTKIENISIYMEDGTEKQAKRYKKGVLEVSLDKSTWTPVGTFDNATVSVSGLDVTAQFIRYRATEEYVDPATGSPSGMLLVREFVVNAAPKATIYTDVDSLKGHAITVDNEVISLDAPAAFTLAPNAYFGFRFSSLKNVGTIAIDADTQDLALEYSKDGVSWKPVQTDDVPMQARYVRARNASNAQKSVSLHRLSVKLGARKPQSMSAALNESCAIYSGKVADLIDGKTSTALWLKNVAAGKSNRTITLDLGESMPIYDVLIQSDGDLLTTGTVQISSNGTDWGSAVSFSGAGATNLVDCGAQRGRYVRIEDTIPSKWIKLTEISINTGYPETVSNITGTVSGVEKVIDGNLLSTLRVGADAGELVWDNVDGKATNFILVKNANAEVALSVTLDDGKTWTPVGRYDMPFCNINLGEYSAATQFKLSWDCFSGLELHEVGAYASESFVESVTVSPATATVHVGDQLQMNALVQLQGTDIHTVRWTVTGGAAGTSIDETGLLTISPTETADALQICATATEKPQVSGTSLIHVVSQDVNLHENLALGQPAAASDIESASYPASGAVDGSTAFGNRWSSTIEPGEKWLMVDLERMAKLSMLEISWYKTDSNPFKIQVSTDQKTWTDVHVDYDGINEDEVTKFTPELNDRGLAYTTTLRFDTPVEARYVRTLTNKVGSGYPCISVLELKAFGTVDKPMTEKIVVTPIAATVYRGQTQQMTARVQLSAGQDAAVVWSVSGGGAGTSIDEKGLLRIAANEMADSVIVTATSVAQTTLSTKIRITLATASSGGSSGSNPQTKPSVSVSGAGGKATADSSGSVTITLDTGYQIAKITVNGKEVAIPANGKLTGLKATDKVVVTFEKVKEPIKPGAADFADMQNHWAKDAVQFVTENGIMNGTGANTFDPDASMTRAMVWTVLARMKGIDTASGANWYEAAQKWSMENGISDGTMPEGSITREQLAALLYRYAGSPQATGTLAAFTDTAQVSGWATDAMRWAVEAKILSGKDDSRLDPTAGATRAEVATMLMRYLTK